jgi:hypothetical protein
VEASASRRERLQVVPHHFTLADIITWDVAPEKQSRMHQIISTLVHKVTKSIVAKENHQVLRRKRI